MKNGLPYSQKKKKVSLCWWTLKIVRFARGYSISHQICWWTLHPTKYSFLALQVLRWQISFKPLNFQLPDPTLSSAMASFNVVRV